MDRRAQGPDIIRKQLQLLTERGEQRRYHVVWNQARIDGLCKRYGIDDTARQALLNVILSVESAIEDYRNKAASTCRDELTKRAFSSLCRWSCTGTQERLHRQAIA